MMCRKLIAGASIVLAFVCAPTTAHAQRLLGEPTASVAEQVRTIARSFLGVPYVWGGEDPTRGFDCSGLVQYVWSALGVNLPRTSIEQAKVGTPIPLDTNALMPGDLLTFGNKGKVSHIGIYLGGGRFVHASTGKHQVVEARIDRPLPRGAKPWIGARRVLTQDIIQALPDPEAAITGAVTAATIANGS